MRNLIAILLLQVAAAGSARAAPDGDTLLAIGFGPSATVSGPLADEVHGDGAAVRVRFGGRFGRLGAELVLTAASLGADDGGRDVALLAGPSLTWYAVANPWFQLGARGGLGAGAITGDHTRAVPCDRTEECTTKMATVSVERGGFGVDVGVTAQLALGARTGGRLVLWLDAGAQLVRFQFDDRAVSGRSTQITIGVGHGMAL